MPNFEKSFRCSGGGRQRKGGCWAQVVGCVCSYPAPSVLFCLLMFAVALGSRMIHILSHAFLSHPLLPYFVFLLFFFLISRFFPFHCPPSLFFSCFFPVLSLFVTYFSSFVPGGFKSLWCYGTRRFADIVRSGVHPALISIS